MAVQSSMLALGTKAPTCTPDLFLFDRERKHLNIKVSGLVQGVFFRSAAQKKAESLGIGGFVRNQPDGTVYIEAEGSQKALDEFIKWCHDSSEAAEVETVTITKGELKNFSDFKRDFADY